MFRRMLLSVVFVATTVLAAGFANADTHADYLLYCRGCHLANGEGVPPEVPTLVNALGELLASPEGREYIIRVPGVSQTALNNEDLAAVLNWVITEFNSETLPADFRPYTAEEVAAARNKVLEDPLRTRARILSD